jgi:transposase-like protein
MSMTAASYRRHRLPPAIIAHAVCLHLRFALSPRAVEKMLLDRGVEVSYETLRRRAVKFGTAIARGLRLRQQRSGRVGDVIAQEQRPQRLAEHIAGAVDVVAGRGGAVSIKPVNRH